MFHCPVCGEMVLAGLVPMKYAPKTERGKRLAAIRAKIVASGAPLMDLDQINKELADGRRELT